jgi:4-amino-4-deoxy-L-arabinose transferase-like glycosyltransferase
MVGSVAHPEAACRLAAGRDTLTRSRWLAGLAGVMCLATFFRAYDLPKTPPGLFFDEAANGVDALQAIHTGHWSVFYKRNGGREGLFINLQSLMLRATGVREPWVLRSVSAMFGVLTVLAVAMLGRELFGADVGLVAGLFMAVGFWHVNFSRIGLRAISAPFFLTWAIVLLFVAQKKRSPAFCLLAGILYGLGFHTYIAYRVTPVIFGFAAIFILRNVRKLLAVTLSSAASAFPLALYFRAHPEDFLRRVSEVAAPSPAVVMHNAVETFSMLLIRGDSNWRHNVSGSAELWLPVGLLLIAGLIFCLMARPRPPGALLLIWLVAGALPAILANEGVPHALRSILMTPPVYLIAALGFAGLYRLWPRRFVAAGLLAAIAMQGYIEYFLMWRNDARVSEAFGAKYLNQAYAIREASRNGASVYVIVHDLGVSDPLYMAQPVIFLTDSGEPSANVHYVPEGGESRIPPGSLVFHISP